ncbi:MAG TPA: HAD hydrolase family protein [Cyclobacteriaceae bacterium]|nr:HAD hydrolase family protein [Cyclobacteriaceae bacterium]
MKHILNRYTKEQIKRAGAIKAVFFETDGVLTDGKIMYDDAGRESKAFTVKDSNIVSALKKAGMVVGIIACRDSKTVSHLAADLKLDFCHQGIIDKHSVLEKLIAFHKLKNKQVAYIGADLADLSTLAACGLSACPADALSYVKTHVDVVTEAKGGQGVLREIADFLLAARGELEKLVKG